MAIIESTEMIRSTVGFVCDVCGVTYNQEQNPEHVVEINERFTYSDIGGEGSIWGDGTRVSIDLCQSCTKNLLGPYLRLTREW